MKLVPAQDHGEHPAFGRFRRLPPADLVEAVEQLLAAGVRVAVYDEPGTPYAAMQFKVGRLDKIGACEVIRQARRLGAA